jgi:hypothetical protein
MRITATQIKGSQAFRQAGHIEKYYVLPCPEHSSVSIVTNTKLITTMKTNLCNISGSHGGKFEDESLLGRSAV